jgi:thiaminase/transcriptional activator TenA
MTTEPFSETLRRLNRAAWDAMQSHRFVRDVEANRLPDGVFRRYLAYEGDFVAAAITIFGQAMLKAPGIDEKRWLIGVLAALANEQVGYFEETFAALGVPAEDRAARDAPPAVAAFRDGMLAIAAEGSYFEIVTAMLAAEWMYATWCARAVRRPIANPELKRWVDLHADAAFRGQAEWLTRQVDALAPACGGPARERAVAVFGRVLALEIDFHEAPYGAERP